MSRLKEQNALNSRVSRLATKLDKVRGQLEDWPGDYKANKRGLRALVKLASIAAELLRDIETHE
jgi:hypothetical protein